MADAGALNNINLPAHNDGGKIVEQGDVVDLLDLPLINEEGQALTANNMEQLLHQQDMDAAEMDSMEMLRNVFDSMATNGKITMDQLPFVLVGAEVQATAREIEEAIEEHIPDSDDTEALLDFHQVQCLYQQLAHNSADMAPINASQDGELTTALLARENVFYRHLSDTMATESKTNTSELQEPVEDLTEYVQKLLEQMQSRFESMSSTILSRIEDMSSRIDELEKSITDLMEQIGVQPEEEGQAEQAVATTSEAGAK